MKKISIALVCSAACLLTAADLLKAPFENAKIAPHTWRLPNNKWGANYWVHLSKADGDYQVFMKKVNPFLKREIVTEGKQAYARITTGMEIMQFKNNKNQNLMVSNQLVCRTVLPANAAEKSLTLSLRFRGKLLTKNSGINNACIFLRFRDNTVYEKGKYLPGEVIVRLSPKANWQNCKKSFKAPKNAKLLDVLILLYGPGQLDVDDVTIQ